MSLPSDSPSSPRAAKPGREERPPRRWSARLLLGLFVLALVGPCTVSQAPREVGRWQLASAIKLWNEGQRELAHDRLESAMRWLPDSPMLLLQRADFHLQEGKQDQALQDANRAVELAPDNFRVLMLRAHVLQSLGRHAKAIEDWKAIAHQSEMSGEPDPTHAYNGLAYAQAVGGLELDAGLKNVEKALRLTPLEDAGSRASMIDTRGFLLYRQGAFEAALGDLNVAVKGMESAARAADQRAVTQPFASTHSAERGIAVVRYHRALALMALGRESEAEQDLIRVRELIGQEPDDTLF